MSQQCLGHPKMPVRCGKENGSPLLRATGIDIDQVHLSQQKRDDRYMIQNHSYLERGDARRACLIDLD